MHHIQESFHVDRDGSNLNQPKICLLSASALTIHFFFKSHIFKLLKIFSVTLALNPKIDDYLPPLEFPIKTAPIAIARKISPLQDCITIFQLLNLFRKERFDLIITVVPKAGLLGMLAGYLCGIPRRLHIFQGEVWASRSGISRLILKYADIVTSRLATNVLAVSDSERLFLIQEKVVSPNKIGVLGSGSICGVDLKRYPLRKAGQERLARIRLGIPEDAIVVIFLARLVTDKGIYDLADACASLTKSCPNLWVLLVGPDEQGVLSRVMQHFGEMRSRVKIFGYTSKPEKYLLASSFICLPSHREGFGLVIIEAAAMGLPAIGSNIYGISDAIVDGKTGIIFEKGNILELQDAILALYKSEPLRVELGTAAHNFVSEFFDHEVVINRYVKYIRNLF